MKKLLSLFAVAAIGFIGLRCKEAGVSGPLSWNEGPTPVRGLVISNARVSSAATPPVGRASSSVTRDDGAAYVSLEPGTLPGAVEFQIENYKPDSYRTLVRAREGGFDPVLVKGSAGDSLTLTPRTANGAATPMTARIPAKRPPSVVRTNPSKGRTDVALNVIVQVVFTEPVDRRTATPSTIQLLRGSNRVAGTVFVQDDSWNVEFVPETTLDPESVYELHVTRDVRDLDGDALEEEYSATFVTGPLQCGVERQSECAPTKIEGNRAVTGTVTQMTEAGSRPLANAMVSTWVQPTAGDEYAIDVRSDANGVFTVKSLPAGKVQLHAIVAGFDQPCAVVASPTLPAAEANIELVASGSPVELVNTTGQATYQTTGYNLQGFVYESNHEMPMGIPGARVVMEVRDNIVASATSDAEGNFTLCALPSLPSQNLSVVKFGYDPASRLYFPVDGWNTTIVVAGNLKFTGRPGWFWIMIGLTPSAGSP
jgi:hypothetical protein